ELPGGPDWRKGVPQGQHAHGLLSRGLDIISSLFPGLRADLIAGGAVEADISAMVWHAFGGWKKRFETGIRGMFQSRPYLEWHIRRRVAALANVAIREQTAVTGLVVDAARRIQGVQIAGETMSADFVV